LHPSIFQFHDDWGGNQANAGVSKWQKLQV